MGIFDFFKRRRTTKGGAERGAAGATEPDPVQRVDPTEALRAAYEEVFGSSPPKPRHEHYAFAHHKLRRMVLDNPEDSYRLLHGEHARDFLSHMWHRDLHDQPERMTDPTLSFDQVQIHRTELGTRPTVIVEMPEPKVAPEAYFVAMVWPRRLDADDDMFDPESGLLYLTLELCGHDDEPKVPVLCHWWRNGSHYNYGEAPDPSLDSFVKHVTRRFGGGSAGSVAEG